jgi:hypothetical protein
MSRRIGGIEVEVVRSTGETYLIRLCTPPSPTRRAFLKNPIRDTVLVTTNSGAQDSSCEEIGRSGDRPIDCVTAR